MLRSKEFILKSSYYSNDTIDNMINDFLKSKEENGILVSIINVAYTSNTLGGSNEMYVRALLIYKEHHVPTLTEEEYNDEFIINKE